LRTLVDNLKQKLGEGVVVLASAQPEGKVALIAGVTPGLTKRIQAGKLVGAVAKLVGGSGGGKPEIAEAGGKDQAQIDAALQAAPRFFTTPASAMGCTRNVLKTPSGVLISSRPSTFMVTGTMCIPSSTGITKLCPSTMDCDSA
jgi:hypothetical protein